MLNKKTLQDAFNMSNTLARAAHGLNLSEKRIIAMGLVKTDQVPSKGLFLAQNQGWKIKLSATEYAEEFGLTHDTAYNQLKSASEKLWNRYIRYIVQTRRGPKEAKFRWISG